MQSRIESSERVISKLDPPRVKGRTLILHCNSGLGPAYIYYWTLRIGGVTSIELEDCVTGMSNLLPYTDYDQVIIWSNSDKDPSIVAAYQNSTLMNYPTRIMTPPLSPALEEYFDSDDLTVFESDSSYYTMSLAALKWGVNSGVKKDLRMERLASDVEEGFKNTVEGLLEAYSSELDALKGIADSKEVTVVYSPPQLPAAIHHYLLNPLIHVVSHWSLRHGVKRMPYTVFYGTSVDEGYYKDIWYKLASPRITKVILNVDPLTAPLYTMIIQGEVYGKLL